MADQRFVPTDFEPPTALVSVHFRLEPLGPLNNKAPFAYRAVAKFLRKRRARGEQRFKAACRFV